MNGPTKRPTQARPVTPTASADRSLNFCASAVNDLLDLPSGAQLWSP